MNCLKPYERADLQINRKIAAIVLGAGLSTRMNGYPKPLIKSDGRFFAEYIYDNLIKLDLSAFFFITGYKSKTVEKYLSCCSRFVFIYNENYRLGQFSSLQCGIQAAYNADPEITNILITLADTPFINQETYRLLMSAPPDKIIIPSYNNRAGHPVIIPRVIADKMLKAPVNSTAKKIINEHKYIIHYAIVDDPGIFNDYDNYETLNNINAEFIDDNDLLNN